MGRARGVKDKTYYRDRPYAVALGDLPLVVTTQHLWQAPDRYHDKIVRMDPEDFLRLTTRYPEDAALIVDEGWDVDDYNEFAIWGVNIHMPSLWIDIDENGVASVHAHEGRHRAGAVLRDFPRKKMYVAIRIQEVDNDESKRHSHLRDLPGVVYGEFLNPHIKSSRDWAVVSPRKWKPVTSDRDQFFDKLGKYSHGEYA